MKRAEIVLTAAITLSACDGVSTQSPITTQPPALSTAHIEDAPATPKDEGGSLLLPIPDRKQDPASPEAGWCGETAIQEALLHLGMWAPQRAINQAGHPSHPDLYSNDIPVALTALGVRFAFYPASTSRFDAYATWVGGALEHDEPVLAGVKILPTEHPEWGLDHFVLVVGSGPKGLLVNTTWGHREWVRDTTTKGLSFKGARYGIRLLGLTLPKNAEPARLVVLEERKADVRVRLTCPAEPGGAVRIERRKSAGDTEPAWSQTVRATSPTIEQELTIDASEPARFQCLLSGRNTEAVPR